MYIKKLFEDVPIKCNVFNIVFIIVWTALDCAFVYLLSNLISNVANGSGNFFGLAIVFILFVLFWEITEYVGDIVCNFSLTHIENGAYHNAFTKLYVTSPNALKQSNTGYIAGLLNKTVSKKEKAYMSIVQWLLMGILYNVYVIFQLGQFSWLFGIVTLLVIIMAISIRLVATKVLKTRVDNLNVAEANRTKLFMDAITNISTVQKLRSKVFFDNKMNDIEDTCYDCTKKWTLLDDLFFCSYKTLMYLLCPIVLILMNFISEDTSFNRIEFLSFLSLTEVKLVHYSKNIANAIRDYNLWKISQKKLDEITSNVNKEYIKTSIGDKFTTIELRDISYSYKNEKDNLVTIDIPNFTIEKGDFISISGKSGQGKTTTLNILTGAIEGQLVYIDGQVSSNNIGAVYISQDVEMFDMSLRDNLCLGRDIDDNELIELLSQVGMKEWYDKQPDGLDTILGERGVFISTGQRQRLNLLRGLLIQDSEIYLLDEPTSNVDSETEEQIVNLIEQRLKGKTVVIVTHRNAIKKICNKFYLFENGIMTKI